MLNQYRLFQRANGVFYWQDNESGQQGSLRTKDRKAAQKLLHAKNEAHRLPTLNLTMARAYLSAHDSKMSTRMDGRHARDGHARSPIQSGALRACLLLKGVRFDPQQAARPELQPRTSWKFTRPSFLVLPRFQSNPPVDSGAGSQTLPVVTTSSAGFISIGGFLEIDCHSLPVRSFFDAHVLSMFHD